MPAARTAWRATTQQLRTTWGPCPVPPCARVLTCHPSQIPRRGTQTMSSPERSAGRTSSPKSGSACCQVSRGPATAATDPRPLPSCQANPDIRPFPHLAPPSQPCWLRRPPCASHTRFPRSMLNSVFDVHLSPGSCTWHSHGWASYLNGAQNEIHHRIPFSRIIRPIYRCSLYPLFGLDGWAQTVVEPTQRQCTLP